MEAIREYLNNLFMSLPETPEVLRAKAELLEMMEDKFEKLVSEGKTEKEAIGIVISEFGNLQELAEELGIDSYMKKAGHSEEEEQSKEEKAKGAAAGPEKKRNVYCWSFDEARDYISYAWRHGLYVALGVLLCICAPFADCIISSCREAGYMSPLLTNIFGTSSVFLFAAVAVVLFCTASSVKKGYGKVSRYCLLLDEKASRYVEQKQQKDVQTRFTMRIVGIACCILSVFPSSVNYFTNPLLREIVDSSVLVIAGVGVFLLVLSASVGNRYTELEKAVKNAGNMEGTTFQGAVWHTAPKKRMSATAILLLVLIGFLIVGGNLAAGLLYMRSEDAGYSTVSEAKEYDFGEIRKIIVDLDFADLRIERSEAEEDAGKVKVEYDGNSRYRPEVTSSEGKLQIRERGKGFRWFSFDIGWFTRSRERKAGVIVTLPPNMDQKEYDIQIDTDMGNVTCSGIQVSNLSIDLDAGNALLEECNVSGEAAVEVDAGNVEVSHSAIGFMKGDVDAGSVTYTLTGAPIDSYTMDLDVDLGDIQINGERKGGSYSQSPRQQTDGTRSDRIQLEVDLGDIDIEAPTQ